jgi:hypothetical protein
LSTQPPTPSPARPSRPAGRTPLAFLALAGTCVVAAGVGGYVAQSHRTAELPTLEARQAQPAPVIAPSASPARSTSSAATRPAAVEDTTVPTSAEVDVPARSPRAAAASPEPVEKPTTVRKPSDASATRTARVATTAHAPQAPAPSSPPARTVEPAPPVEAPSPEPPAAAEAQPPAPVEPVAKPQAAKVSISETFTVPADSVLGLELEQTVSSETAQPEDRIDARVTRDVKVDGTTVIPAGSRVRGAVTRVENGGRFKDRGRIEIRFHTLVLADGDTQSIATDALFREGDNVGKKASARIGASAAGGAIIGAIFGGEKGAAIGAAAGAGAGTAVTASQKPSEARFRAGSVVTVRLTAPISITVQQ